MSDKNYEVGYGKPPKHTQFQPGQSGFKNRKHKKKKSASDIFEAILSERISVVEDGKTKWLTRCELFLHQLVVRGIKAEKQASDLLFEYLFGRAAEAAAADNSVADDFLMAELTRMFSDRSEGANDAAE